MKTKILITLIVCLVGAGIYFSTTQSTVKPIVIHDGQFSEMRLIHKMVKMLVEEYTPVKVEIRDEMSPVNSFNTMLKGDADLMNCYDGTLLATFLRIDPSNVPKGTTLYDFANKTAMDRHKVRLLKKLGLNNTYAVAVTQATAEKYNLESIGDLVPVANELVFGGEHEFFSQEGSARFGPFRKHYDGLKFKDTKTIDINLKYSAMESGNIDVTIVYATDGMNKKARLKILKDDRRFFPEYNGAILVRDDLFPRFRNQAPHLEEVINRLGGVFTDEVMTSLTYAVDVDGKQVDEVAGNFLREKELIQ